MFQFNLSTFFKNSLGFNFSTVFTTNAYWNDHIAPNSKSIAINPGLTYIINSDYGPISINLNMPFFIDGSFKSNEGDIKQSINTIQCSIGYRRLLDYTIPWLYW